jgi:hypothetical protein
MSAKSTKELAAFHEAKENKSPEKRRDAIVKITRKGLLMRLLVEGRFNDARLAALRKLAVRDSRSSTAEEFKLYLDLSLNEKDPEIRQLCARRVDLSDRDKLANSAFSDVRLFLAQTTSSRDILLRLLMDKNPNVRNEAEKSFSKKGLQPHSGPHSVN